MGLDIHKLQEGQAGEWVTSIDDSELAELSNAFDLFSAKTGLFIDPYGDMKFSSGLKALIQSLEETDTGSKTYCKLLELFRELDDKSINIIFVGD